MENKTNTWKLKEIILAAMICIVFGVVYLAGVYLASMIAGALTPFGLSPLATFSRSPARPLSRRSLPQ